jgi:5-methyltetrahydrofolate--homocysteine methyltransferase
MPYTATLSFDTAGRTMMGILPSAIRSLFDGLPEPPLAMGANCGVGASDILVSLLEMSTTLDGARLITKGNCGVPRFVGTDVVYSGTPELMAEYVHLALHAGARIVGGCCGTSPKHLAAMREAMDSALDGERPSIDSIIAATGPLCNTAPSAATEGRERRRSRRGE